METLVPTFRLRSECRLGGRQLIADGINPNLCHDGNPDNLRAWGLEPPTTDFTATESSGPTGIVTPGTHLIGVTFAIIKGGSIFIESNIKALVTATASSSLKFFTLTNLPLSTNSAVNARIVYLTKADSSTLFRLYTSYIPIPDNTTTTYLVNVADASLSAVELSYANEYLPAKPYVAEYNNRALLWGDVPWTRGTVAVTNASATVTGTGTQWPSTMRGRQLVVADGQLAYTVASVDTGAQTLTLSAAYQGSTATGAAYRLLGEANDMYVSSPLPGSPEGYDISDPNSIVRVKEDDGDRPTGIMRTRDLVYLGKRRHLYLMTGATPATYDFTEISRDKGLASHWAWGQIDGGPVVFYHGDGISLMDTNQPRKISGPIDAIFNAEVNHALDEQAHAVYYNRRNLFLLWTARRGESRVMDKVIAGDFSRYPDWVSWWEFRLPARVSKVFRPEDGIERVVLGGFHGQLWVWDCNDVDCPQAPATTLEGTVTATDGTSYLEDDDAFFGDATLAGVRVTMLSGAAAGYSRLVLRNPTASRLNFDTRADFGGVWSPAIAAGDRYTVGAFESYWTTPDLSLGRNENKRWLTTQVLTGKPTGTTSVDVHQYASGDGMMRLRGVQRLYTAGKQDHLVRHSARSEFLRLRFGATGPAMPWALRNFTVRAADGRGIR
jgi:hypothetical protein